MSAPGPNTPPAGGAPAETTPATTTPPAATPTTPPAPGSGDNETIRHMRAELDKKEQERRAAQDQLDAINTQKKKDDDEAAKKRGDFEKLANDRQAEIDRLKGEVEKRDRDALRVKVAAKHKLPEALASRIVGNTEAEMEADAVNLAKTIGPAPATNNDANRGNNPKPPAAPPAKPGEGGEERKQSYRFQQPGDVPW